MKIPALACALLCFFAAPELTKAQGFKKLQRIHIVVEDLNNLSRDMGLTEESITNQALVALKRDIPKLKIESSLDSIYIRITSVPIESNAGRYGLASFVPVESNAGRYGLASFVEVSLRRNVRVVGVESLRTPVIFATVWDKGAVFTGDKYGVASAIHQEIDDELRAFAAQYYKENP